MLIGVFVLLIIFLSLIGLSVKNHADSDTGALHPADDEDPLIPSREELEEEFFDDFEE